VALGLGVTKTPYDPRSAEISAPAEEIRGALLEFKPRLGPKKAQRIQWDTDFIPPGTGSSNQSPSSRESDANLTFGVGAR
jgi:hypothetical protein